MLADPVIARLDAEVPDLAGRVAGALELSALIRAQALPQTTPAAFVLPLALRGGAGEAVTGLYRQIYDEVVSIVLVHHAHGDATGETAIATIDGLVADVIDAIAGWAPSGEIGVFRLSRGDLVSLTRGTVIYQVDFAISDQLRIAS